MSNYFILQVLRDFWSLKGSLKQCGQSLRRSLDYGGLLIDKLFDNEISFENFLSEKTNVVMSQFYVVVCGWDDQILISQLQDYLYDYLLTLITYEFVTVGESQSIEK